MDTDTRAAYIDAALTLSAYQREQERRRNAAAWRAITWTESARMASGLRTWHRCSRLAEVAREAALEHDANQRDAWADRCALVDAVEAG